MKHHVKQIIILSCMLLAVRADDQSFILEPLPKKGTKIRAKRSKLRERLVRGCRKVLNETAQMIEQVSKINRCAGDCAADVLESGPISAQDKRALAQLVDEVEMVADKIASQRTMVSKVADSLQKKATV